MVREYNTAHPPFQIMLPFYKRPSAAIHRFPLHGIFAVLGSVSSLSYPVSLSENPDRTHSGGGADYIYKTPYYDFVSSKNEIYANDYAVIHPVTIKYYGSKSSTDTAKLQDNLKVISERDFESVYNNSNLDNDEIKKALDLYNNNENEKAEKILLNYSERSSVANTYLAVITIKKARYTSDTTKKVDYVNRGFNIFDKAESLVNNDNDLYRLLSNRIDVILSDKSFDEVFDKYGQAENDIKKILSLPDLTNEEKAKYTGYLIDIYKKKNKIGDLRVFIKDIEEMNIE